MREQATVPDSPASVRPLRRLARARSALLVVGAAALGAWIVVRSTRALTHAGPPESRVAADPSLSSERRGPAAAEPSMRAAERAPAGSPSTPSLARVDSATSPETVTVQLKIRPEGARIFERGKEVGRSPHAIDLNRGERHVYEVTNPGYVTRRVVVDGSRPVISFMMNKTSADP